MKRADVVIVELPYIQGGGGKKRRALIVQNDRDNLRLANTIVVMISGNVQHAGEATQFLIDPSTPEGKSSGLHGLSVVKCANLYTVAQADIRGVIGKLSHPMMAKVDDALKAALSLR